MVQILIFIPVMHNDSYISSPLNQSKTKYAHPFPKQKRFNKHERVVTQAIYNLPSMQSKRSTCFGFGNKVNFIDKNHSPPPGTYKLPSEFEKKKYSNTPSIAQGRETVRFGSFLLQALKSNKDKPAPNKYTVYPQKTKIGGDLGHSERMASDPDFKSKKHMPGPGAYQTKATQISNGQYFLSTFKNNTSPRYMPDSTLKSSIKKRVSLTSASYEIQAKQPGKYQDSRYKNAVNPSFSKSKRQGLAYKHSLKTPGFKYRRFSQFGSFF